MTSKSPTRKQPKTIGTNVMSVEVPSGLFGRKQYRMLDSRELLRSLHLIREMAVEEHTRNNLQTLIDQIYGSNLNV